MRDWMTLERATTLGVISHCHPEYKSWECVSFQPRGDTAIRKTNSILQYFTIASLWGKGQKCQSHQNFFFYSRNKALWFLTWKGISIENCNKPYETYIQNGMNFKVNQLLERIEVRFSFSGQNWYLPVKIQIKIHITLKGLLTNVVQTHSNMKVPEGNI